MRPILLHICCGICSSWAIEKLKSDGFQVKGFFFNPNIQPEEEYCKRLRTAQEVARLQGIELLAGEYGLDKWQQQVKGLENQPEGGERCQVCFRFRLEEAWRQAQELGIKEFATTLTISPHKDFELIKSIGQALSREGFLAYNFKKEDGFKKANIFCREKNLYRQDYCGCLYSRSSARTPLKDR